MEKEQELIAKIYEDLDGAARELWAPEVKELDYCSLGVLGTVREKLELLEKQLCSEKKWTYEELTRCAEERFEVLQSKSSKCGHDLHWHAAAGVYIFWEAITAGHQREV